MNISILYFSTNFIVTPFIFSILFRGTVLYILKLTEVLYYLMTYFANLISHHILILLIINQQYLISFSQIYLLSRKRHMDLLFISFIPITNKCTRRCKHTCIPPHRPPYIRKPFCITRINPLFVHPILTGCRMQDPFLNLSFSLRTNFNLFS